MIEKVYKAITILLLITVVFMGYQLIEQNKELIRLTVKLNKKIDNILDQTETAASDSYLNALKRLEELGAQKFPSRQ